MKTNLTINIGKDEYGANLAIDLSKIKHLLMTGSTGSGKSVLLHKIITTLISNNSPEDLRLILIDPKRVEMTLYKNIPYLLTETIVDPRKAVLAMKWATKEIDRRFDILNTSDCKDISQYNGLESIAPILIVIDEFSDLMQTYPKEVEPLVLKIARIGHSVGIYIIISTSRPSTKIYTKAIQDAFTSRIGLQTASSVDSRLIIGTDDASTLRGAGDILFRMGMKYVIRGQVDFISEYDIKILVKALSDKYADSVRSDINTADSYLDDSDDKDDLYESAKEAAIAAGKISTSYLQRKLGTGYSRSAQLMDMLEKRGVIGPANGSKPREVIGK
jgi:S-DNA-T family DNA segregation ATPase FtsK/SpoIIIE